MPELPLWRVLITTPTGEWVFLGHMEARTASGAASTGFGWVAKDEEESPELRIGVEYRISVTRADRSIIDSVEASK